MYIGYFNYLFMLKAVSIAGIEEQGVPFKKESIALEEAAKTVSIGNLTWIECVVDDIVTETPKILEKLDIKMVLRFYFQDMFQHTRIWATLLV